MVLYLKKYKHAMVSEQDREKVDINILLSIPLERPRLPITVLTKDDIYKYLIL